MKAQEKTTSSPAKSGRASRSRGSRSAPTLVLSAIVLILIVAALVYWSRRGAVLNTSPATAVSNPATSEMHYRNGIRLMEAGNSVAAMQEWSTAIGLDPSYAAPYMAMAEGYEAAGNYVAALKRLDALHMANPRAEHIQCRKADLLLRSERLEAALHTARDAVATEPKCALAHSALGEVLAMDGDYQGAVQELRAAHQIDPDSEGIALTLAQALAKAGRPDEGIRLATAVVTKPARRAAQANLVLGRLLLRDGQSGRPDPAAARACFEKAAAADPNNPAAYAELGTALLRLGEYEAARAAIEKAVRGGDRDTDTVRALADTYAHLKASQARALDQQARALEEMEASIKQARTQHLKSPDDPTVTLRLAKLNIQSANNAEAFDLVQAVLQKDPTNREALSLFRRIPLRSDPAH